MKREEVHKAQILIYEIFKEFDSYCRSNGLRYYMLGGTMLGAVRHKGFIPWDDDIDVGMPRDDYEIFLKKGYIRFMSSTTELLNSRLSPDFSWDFTKIFRKVEVGGVTYELFLDIFPLDGCPSTKTQTINNYYRLFDTLRCIKDTHFMDVHKKRNIVKQLILLFFRIIPQKTEQRWMDSYLRRNQFSTSPAVGNFSGHWGAREIMPRQVYGTPKLYQFEDGMYYGVENADTYLTNMYGDYMKLPPFEEQLSHFS